MLTATPRPADAAVVLAVTAGHVVTRRAAGGPEVPVRGAEPVDAGVAELVDREAPFGVPLTYTSTAPGGQLETASARLDADRPRLEHPGLAALGLWCALVDDTPPAWEGRSAVLDVIGRRAPLVTAQPMAERAGRLRLLVDSPAGVDALVALCASGLPVLLRTPCRSLFRDGWLYVERVSEEAPNPREPQRLAVLDYRVADRPAGDPQGTWPWLWRDVPVAYGTWAQHAAAYPTWADAQAGPVRP